MGGRGEWISLIPNGCVPTGATPWSLRFLERRRATPISTVVAERGPAGIDPSLVPLRSLAHERMDLNSSPQACRGDSPGDVDRVLAVVGLE